MLALDFNFFVVATAQPVGNDDGSLKPRLAKIRGPPQP